MERGRSALAILVLIMLEFYSPTAIAGGVGVSGPVDAQPTEPIGTVEFHPYKVPENVSAKARRDLEFLWSNTYVTRGYPLTALGPDGKNDLDRFGLTLAQDPLVNAFGFDMTHVQLVFDYLNFDGATYSTNTANPGFLVPITGASLDDRKHVDTYFYAPNVSAQDPGDAPGLNNRGAFPSDFISPREDISTGHQESLSDVVFGNATSFAGPRMDQVGDLSPLRWTRPMARTNWTWDHEFQHMFNSRLGGGVFTEIWSSIAEALGGEEADPPIHDVPYTWSVLTGCVGGASGCPRNNYAAWRSFAAYLTYNFRGTDPTFAGRSDDLVWRWARAGGGKRFPELANSLSPGACIECDQKSYFAGMDGHDRLMTLIQNWRIANYVNNPNLYEGQYGFPSQFGFDPVRDVGNWGDIDGDLSDNDVAIPPDVPAMASWRTKEAVFFKRPAGSGFGERPLSLEMFGSEYFIVHADASAIGPSQDLVIRCGSDSSVVERTTDAGCNLYVKDSRLSVSVVAYSAHSAVAGQELFRNPAWARWVVTKSVDVDSVATDLDFVIPGFGDSIQAIVVVASMVDGPSRQYVSESAILGAPRLPLRLEFGLRNHAVQSPNPVLVAGSAYPEAAPTWSPDGAFLAYEGAPSAGAPHQIYKVGLAGGQPTLIHPNPARFQESPDWSPRGDWIAFVQDQLSGARNVWLHIVGGGSGTTQLTYWNGVVGLPVIQPNGQGLVYVMSASPGNSPWQLRRVDVDGANDVLIKTLTYPDGTSMPKPGALRWAPDGSKIFLTVNDTIQSLPSGGGSLGVASTQRAWDFDLPLGQGLVAISEARRIEAAQWCWAHFSLECCSPFGYSAQVAELSRAALLDTAASQVRPRFFRTGASFGDVRWSWDNTRLAYSSNVSGPTNFDLFWGEATLNRAPHVELASAVVTGPLRGDGESVLANSQPWLIAAGEVLALTYSGPVRVEDRARDWMITMVAQAASTPLVELSSMRPQIPSLPVLPLEFKLKQSQPNPSAWSTTIRFDLPAGVPVGLEVFDLFGRKVRTLAHGEWPAGYHAVEWNNRDELGHPVKPGIYLYRLRAGAFVAQRKLVVKP